MSKLNNLLSIDINESKKQVLSYEFENVEGDQIECLISAITLNSRILINGERAVEKAKINDQGGVILSIQEDFEIKNDIVELSWSLGSYEYKTSVITKQKANLIGLKSINTLKKRLKTNYEYENRLSSLISSGDLKVSCFVDKLTCEDLFISVLPSQETNLQQLLGKEVVIMLNPANEEKMVRVVGELKILDQNDNGKIKIKVKYVFDTVESKDRLNRFFVGLAEKKELELLEEFHYKILGL